MASTRKSGKNTDLWHARLAWGGTLLGALVMAAALAPVNAAQNADQLPAEPATPAQTASLSAAAWTTPQCSGCHTPSDLFSHPVDVVPSFEIPADFPLFGGRLTCATCHDADAAADHALARRDHTDLLRGKATGSDFCTQCHSEFGSSRLDMHASMLGRAHLRWDEGGRGFEGTVTRPADVVAAESSDNCLTCHDGSVASDAGHDRASTGLSFSGAGFGRSGHPVSVEYRAGEPDAPPLHTSMTLDERIRLFDDRVECASCHSVYARTPGLLVVSNERSRLCLSCHDL